VGYGSLGAKHDTHAHIVP